MIRGDEPSTIAVSREDSTDRIAQHFARLATIGNQPDGSITRIAYSDEESAAMAYIRAEGESFGLAGSYDAVGNLWLSLEGEGPERFLVGSHLDSVPHGGNYDGAAGVVAGLEALRSLKKGPKPRCGIDLVAWRGEEHTFNAVYKGSSAAFGLCDPHVLHNTYGGISLRDAIRQQGFDPTPIDEVQPALARDRLANITGYLELHIEQGVVLEQEGLDVGVVTSIAGDRRFLVVLEGRFDHSGATPMGKRYRSDVNLAMAYAHVRLDQLANEHRERGVEFTQTVGILNADPEIDKRYPTVHGNSVTKVSGMGYFTLDIMSADEEFLDLYTAEVHRLIWRTAKEFNVSAFIEQTDAAPGLSALDSGLASQLEASARSVGVRERRMASGAGHDAVMVGRADRPGGPIPVAMLFVPCHRGISHSRDEFVHPSQVAQGCAVMTAALQRVATGAAANDDSAPTEE